MSSPEKLCIICREDCAGKPRVRNASGQYACRSCAERRKNARKRSAAPTIAPVVHDEPDALELMLEDVQQPEETGQRCEGCGMRMPQGHVVCMRCGTNSQTGASAAINVKFNKPRLAKATGTQIGIGAATSAAGGLLGLGLWIAVSSAADSPSFVMAAGVGLLAGVGMLIPTRGVGRPITGLIACGMALVFCIAGLALRMPDEPPELFHYPVYVFTETGYREVETEVANFGDDEHSIAGALWLALACCTAFAFGGSNPDPYADGDDE